MKKLILLFLALSLPASAAEIKISASNFEAAEKSPNYFKFIGHSKKLGIIGSSFEGYAKQASLSYSESKGMIEKVKLTIVASELDTDNNSRNDKMKETCLSVKEFPEISVSLKDPINTSLSIQEIPAEMKVRGASVGLVIRLEKLESGAFKGQSTFKLSEAKIPDPSIAIASVKDEFEIEFQIMPETPSTKP